jgi:hypothetical protein
MPDQIIDGRGTGSTLKVNPDGSINVGSITATVGQVDVTGYANNQIIRKASGSPAVNYVFSAVSETLMIDNLGSSPVYFAFDATADVTSSGTGFLRQHATRIFDAEVGSVSIQSSGTTSSEVQCIRLS